MTLDEQFARAVLPDRWRVFGVHLAPVCVGHLLVLQRLGSPFVVGGLPGPSDLAVALYVCAHAPSKVMERWHTDIPLRWKWLAYRIAFVAVLFPRVFAARCALFNSYMAESRRAPSVWIAKNDKGSRRATTPWLLHLHRKLLDAGLDAMEAWDTPVELARFVMCAADERDGLLTFRTDHEFQVAQSNARN